MEIINKKMQEKMKEKMNKNSLNKNMFGMMFKPQNGQAKQKDSDCQRRSDSKIS